GRIGKKGAGQFGDFGGSAPLRGGQRPTSPGAGSSRCPPAATQGRRRYHPGDDLVINHETDESRPYRHTSEVILCPVDRVDHPSTLAVALRAELLGENRITG